MARLANYELANLAAWCFDFDNASQLFSKIAVEFREKQDLFGTLGALEGAAIAHELIAARWKVPPDRVLQKILGATENHVFNLPFSQVDLKDDRAKKFNSLMEGEQKRIIKKIANHKSRLRQTSSGFGRDEEADFSTGAIETLEYHNWFIAVQRLSSFCFSRAYRRDGLVANLETLTDFLSSESLVGKLIDSRFVSTVIEEITMEIWFDGRVCCMAVPKQFESIMPVIQKVADMCNKAIEGNH